MTSQKNKLELIIIIGMQKYLKQQFVCEHHNEPLNLVCLDESCEKQGLICSYCEYTDHKHPVRSLRLLLSEVSSDMQSYSKNLAKLAQIDELSSRIQVQMERLPNQRKLTKEVVNSYFQYHTAAIFARFKQAQQLSHRENLTVSDLNEFIQGYNFISNNDAEKETNIEHQIKGKIEQISNSFKELKEANDNGSDLQKIMRIFELDDSRRIKFYFTNDNCHKDFIITDKTKAELKEGYSYRIALLDPPIRKEGGGKLKKKSCTFKISKVTALVGIGVVYKKKVETAKYLFSAYSQHGCYFITNSGYTYNESNPSYNSQIKNWTYTNNETVKATMEPKQKKILFEKQGKDIFEMPFDDKPDLEVNFAVLLCQQNESVEVV